MTIHIKLILLVLVIFMLGPGFLGFGFRKLYLELRPLRWRKLSAIVTKSEIKHEIAGGGKFQQYLPIVELEYQSNNELIRSNADFFTTGTYDSAYFMIQKYPLGATIPILQNPQRPNLISLGAKITPVSCSFIFLGVLFSALGIIFFSDLAQCLHF